MTKLIDAIYAWVAIDPADDIEGVCGFLASDGAWYPLVMADEARLVSLRPIAELIRKTQGKPMRLIRLSTREVVEELP